MIFKVKDHQEAILMYWAVPGHKAAIIQFIQPMPEWLPHGFLFLLHYQSNSKGQEKVKTGPMNLTEIVENKSKAPLTHSIAKPLYFQKGTMDAVRKCFKAKPPWDSGPQKHSKMYLLSKNVCVRPQTCGIRCLGTQVSSKSLLGLLTAGCASHCISLDQRGWDVCPSLQCRSCLTTGMKLPLPLVLPLLLVRTCSRSASRGKAAGAPYAPEDLSEHALCCGGAIQREMSVEGASLYPILPWHRTRETDKTDPGPS